MDLRLEEQRPASLLFAHDGSRTADYGTDYVRELAKQGEMPVTVLHVFGSIRELTAAVTSDIEWSETATPRAVIKPPATIRESVSILRSAGISVQVIGRIGDVSEQIIRETEHLRDPWIVMTSLGASGIRRMLMGSHASKTVRNANLPVLVVPPTRGEHVGFANYNAKVLTLLDGTPIAERAITAGCGASGILNSEHVLVRVAETLDDSGDDVLGSEDARKWHAEIIDSTERYLEEMAERCRKSDIHVVCALLSGNPSVQINRYVDEHRPAMIVLATKRRSGIERWTYGSFADPLVGTLPSPTLFVPVDVS